jgi:hypothetical protein
LELEKRVPTDERTTMKQFQIKIIPAKMSSFAIAASLSVFVSLSLCSVKYVSAQKTNDSKDAGDQLSLLDGGKEIQLTGDILADGQDGSLYFREDNGRDWFVKPEQVQSKVESEDEAAAISKKEMAAQLLEELPVGFRVYQTKHYLIAYQNELDYAKWVAQLYEGRLYRAFEIFWARKMKLPIEKPKYPLAVLVFGSKAEYQRYVKRDIGPGQDMIAYYNLKTNRVAMYDLTVGQRLPGEAMNERRIEQVLQTPAAIYMVATMIHEATHQLIFNRGVQTRFADTPLWLNEGAAMFFEAPDLSNKRGWRRPGLIFEQRLTGFRIQANSRDENSIKRLVTDDELLRDPKTAGLGYAEAWAFTHFLINRRSKEYAQYIKKVRSKPYLSTANKSERWRDFTDSFGDDIAALEKDFIKYIARLR